MARESSEISQARNELRQYLGPRFVVGRKLGMGGVGAAFLVHDRESGELRVAIFRPCTRERQELLKKFKAENGSAIQPAGEPTGIVTPRK